MTEKERYQKYKGKNVAYRKSHKAKYRKLSNDYYHKHKDILGPRQKKYRLKSIHNLEIDKYNEMFLAQGGCCAICGRHETTLAKPLSVDHNHITGKIRGLLCISCNTALGSLNADVDTALLQGAIKYIQLHSEKPA
jgi:hypothetical protein